MPKAVIIGGGHNGLVCSYYLARKGFDVTNLEIAVTDSQSGLSRILIAVSDQHRKTDERNNDKNQPNS